MQLTLTLDPKQPGEPKWHTPLELQTKSTFPWTGRRPVAPDKQTAPVMPAPGSSFRGIMDKKKGKLLSQNSKLHLGGIFIKEDINYILLDFYP